MSETADDEFKLLLARAFDRAWKNYYRLSRIGAISASETRSALAKHLVHSKIVESENDLTGVMSLIGSLSGGKRNGQMSLETI
jgi:hypothetical protein